MERDLGRRVESDDARLKELVGRARQREPAAFEALVRPEVDGLLRLATAVVLDHGLAEEVVQESLLAAWGGLPSLREHSSFPAWLRRIVINRARNAIRRPRAIRLASARPVSSSGPDHDELFDLERAMRMLSPDHRAIVALYYLEDRSIKQIASVLSIPAGTVKSRLFAARSALRLAIRGSDELPD